METKRLLGWKVKFAKTSGEANFYKQAYEMSGSHVSVEMDYLLGTEPITVYHKGKLIGGCVYNGVLQSRYLDLFKSAKEKRKLLESEKLKEQDFLEMTCIFRKKGTSNLERMIFYCVVLYYAWKYLKKFKKIAILSGSVVKAIQEQQSKLMKHILLRTPVNRTHKLFHKVDGIAMIYYVRVEEFVFNAIAALLNDVWQRVFKF
jgi:hypothetical protein